MWVGVIAVTLQFFCLHCFLKTADSYSSKLGNIALLVQGWVSTCANYEIIKFLIGRMHSPLSNTIQARVLHFSAFTFSCYCYYYIVIMWLFMKGVYASWCFTIKPCNAIKDIKSVLEWCIKFMHSLMMIIQDYFTILQKCRMRNAYPDIDIEIPRKCTEWDTEIVVVSLQLLHYKESEIVIWYDYQLSR